jgi:hypothetical protein
MSDIPGGIAALTGAIAQASTNSNLGAAVSTLQAAGNAAVGDVGPAIDSLSGNDPNVTSLTQFAWNLNGNLSAVANDSSASSDDVTSASAIVSHMIDLYQQALALAQKPKAAPAAVPASASIVKQVAPVPVPVAPVAAVSTSPSVLGEVATVGSVGLVGLVVGSRVLGTMVGGVVGLAVGSLIGYGISKIFNI